jgi:hypothetical protein
MTHAPRYSSVPLLDRPLQLTYRAAGREVVIDGIPVVVVLIGGALLLAARGVKRLLASDDSGGLDFLGAGQASAEELACLRGRRLPAR